MLYPTELRGHFNVAIPYTTEPMASSAFRARLDWSLLCLLPIKGEESLAIWNGSGPLVDW